MFAVSWLQPAQGFLNVRLPAQSRRRKLAPGAESFRRQMSFAERNLNRKGAAAIDFTLRAHVAAMQLYQHLDQGEADARTFVTPAARTSHAMKTFEHVRQRVRWN